MPRLPPARRLIREPEVAAFVQAHYVVVTVDVGHMDKNLDIPGHWGMKRVEGVPNVLIVDAHDKLVNAGHTSALSDAQAHEPAGAGGLSGALDGLTTDPHPAPPWR